MLATLHYESELDSGIYDAEIDVAPVRVDNAQLDGWMVTVNGWHYALGQPGDKSTDGWVGFGGRQGQHWFKFRLARVGYLHWPTRSWDDIGGAPNYGRAFLSQTTHTLEIGPNSDPANIGSAAIWEDIWKTPGGGSLSLRWLLDGDRLKEDVIINQAGREWIEANHPPATPLSETWFGFVFQLDWSDIPKCVIDGVLQDIEGDFTDDAGQVELRDALDRLLGFLPISTVRIEEDEVAPGDLVQEPIRKRFWKDSDGNHYLLMGVRCDLLAAMPAGALIFDPTVNLSVTASTDDARESAGEMTLDGSYIAIGGTAQAGGWRFLNCTVPKDATINSAVHQVYVQNSANDDFDWRIYCEYEANAGTFTTSTNDISNRTKTTAYTDWVETDSGNGYQSVPGDDLTDEVDEVTSHASWSSGNAIVILAFGQSSASSLTRAYDSGSNVPLFDIDYTSGPSVVEGAATLSGAGTLTAVGEVSLVDSGQVNLSGAGVLTAIGLGIQFGIAAASGSGALSAIGESFIAGVATLSGAGALSAIGLGIQLGIAAISGAGNLSAVGEVTQFGIAALSGAGALSAQGVEVVSGAASLTGAGALSAVGAATQTGVAALSGAGNLSAVAEVTEFGVASLSGSGALVAIGTAEGVIEGVAQLSGAGALTAVGAVIEFGVATLSGTGALTAIGVGVVPGVATLSGVGALAAIGDVTEFGVATLSGTGALAAIADVTEFGAANLAGTGALVAIGSIEGLIEGTAHLTGTGALTAVGSVIEFGIAALSGSGALTASGAVIEFGVATLTGTGALIAIGQAEQAGVATLSGAGALAAVADVLEFGVAALSGQGSLTAIGEIGGIVEGVAHLTGQGNLSGVPLVLVMAVAALSGTGSLSASGYVPGMFIESMFRGMFRRMEHSRKGYRR